MGDILRVVRRKLEMILCRGLMRVMRNLGLQDGIARGSACFILKIAAFWPRSLGWLPYHEPRRGTSQMYCETGGLSWPNSGL